MGGIGAGGATGADVDMTTGGNTTGSSGNNGATTGGYGTTSSGMGGGTSGMTPASNPASSGMDDPLTQGVGYGASPPGDAPGMFDDDASRAGGYAGVTGGAPAGGTGAVGGKTFADQAQGLKSQAIDKVRTTADEGKIQVANTLDGIVEAARDLATRLEGGQYGPVGGYARTVADTLDGWAHTVRDKPVDAWFDDGRELVRRSPVLAAGIAVAAGFVLSRFLKAGGPSAPRYTA